MLLSIVIVADGKFLFSDTNDELSGLQVQENKETDHMVKEQLQREQSSHIFTVS